MLRCVDGHCYDSRIHFSFDRVRGVTVLRKSAVEASMTAIAPEKSGSRAVADVRPPSMVERMTLILDAFDGPPTRLSLEEVAKRTNLPRSTAHRILDQLAKLDWLEHTSLGYGVGRRALGLGGGDNGHGQVRQAAAEHLHELHLRTGMVIHLAVLDGPDEVILDKLGGRFATALPSRVGGRIPAHQTPAGRAMLAFLDPEIVDGLLSDRLDNPVTARGWTLATLHQDLNRIRQRHGLSIDRTSNHPRWFAAAAVAVRGHDGQLASVSACPETGTPTLERAVPLLVEVGRRISRAL